MPAPRVEIEAHIAEAEKVAEELLTFLRMARHATTFESQQDALSDVVADAGVLWDLCRHAARAAK